MRHLHSEWLCDVHVTTGVRAPVTVTVVRVATRMFLFSREETTKASAARFFFKTTHSKQCELKPNSSQLFDDTV